MSSKQRKIIGVVIKSGAPTEQEQKAIDALPREYKVKVMNGRFVENNSNEKITTYKLLNLSGRKEIDVWYEDILMEDKEFKAAAQESAKADATSAKEKADADHAQKEADLAAAKDADLAAAKKIADDKAAADKKAAEDAKKDVAAKKKAAVAAKPKVVKK